MSSPAKTEGTGRKETNDLTISALIANQPRSESAAKASPQMESSDSVSTAESPKKLPPSPLVTPPMGSSPSQAAQEAVSPRNLLPAEGVSLQGTDAVTATKHPQKGVPHVYHDYAKLSGPGPAYIRKKTGGVTQRKYLLILLQRVASICFVYLDVTGMMINQALPSFTCLYFGTKLQYHVRGSNKAIFVCLSYSLSR